MKTRDVIANAIDHPEFDRRHPIQAAERIIAALKESHEVIPRAQLEVYRAAAKAVLLAATNTGSLHGKPLYETAAALRAAGIPEQQ